MKSTKPIRSLSLCALALMCATGLSACNRADNQGGRSPGGSPTAPGGGSAAPGGGSSAPGGSSSPSGGGSSGGGS